MIGFKDKDSYSFLDNILLQIDRDKRHKYILEKYPDYKPSPGIISYYLQYFKQVNDFESLCILLERFDQWTELVDKCSQKVETILLGIANNFFPEYIEKGLTFSLLANFAKKKGIDLEDLFKKKKLILKV